jgi:hypothetical protein
MGERRQVYRNDSYEGYRIMDDARRNRGKVTEFYEPMLKGLVKLANYGKDGSKFQRPAGVMLSFAFTDPYLDYPISGVMRNIWHTFSKSKLPKHADEGTEVRKGRQPLSTFKPEYLWCREVKYLDEQSPEFKESLTEFERERYEQANMDGCPIPYEHYHVVIVLDDKFGRWRAIKVVMDRLVDKGVVRAGFHFSENNKTKKKTLDLKDKKEFEEFIYRNSYLCKTDTKEISDKKFWSMSSCKKRLSNPRRNNKKVVRL